jgi:hypothetical protein
MAADAELDFPAPARQPCPQPSHEQQGPLVILTMNQPERRNPLTGNTAVGEFLEAIDRCAMTRNYTANVAPTITPPSSASDSA